jgi:hypothetical protein
MSVRENIQFFHRFDPGEYLRILAVEHGARAHPNQDGAFLVDGLPFYTPQQFDEHTFILGFNMAPLSQILIQAVISHPELVPDQIFIRWTQEQDLIAEGTLEDFRQMLA